LEETPITSIEYYYGDIILYNKEIGDNNVAIHFHPNPSQDFINIDSPEKIDAILIRNMQGQKVLQINKPNKQIDVKSIPAGIYTLEILSQGVWHVSKWIKV